MIYDFYITPEEFAQAAKLGISNKRLITRIRLFGWEKQRALTTPPRKITNRKTWATIAATNGISYKTFTNRILKFGWTEEKAATTPLPSPAQQKEMARKANEAQRRLPQDMIDLAAKNGISYKTFYARVRYNKWDIVRAATEPVVSATERGKIGAGRLKEKYGNWNGQYFTKLEGRM